MHLLRRNCSLRHLHRVGRRTLAKTVSAHVPPSPGVTQEEHAERLHSEAFQFLTETKTANKKKSGAVSATILWDRIRLYSRAGNYAEKTVLLDQALATAIADCIAKHSERGPDTLLIDADGGTCDVTARLLEQGVFTSAHVFCRDAMVLAPLQEWANRHHAPLAAVADRVSFKELNLVKIASDYLAAKREFISPLYEAQEAATDWERDHPPYTLYATVTHGFVKYLIQRCLHRQSLLSEFFKGRPEFFLVVSPRTYVHLTSNSESMTMAFRPQNILFQLIFDHEKIMELPRSSFFPWRKPRLLKAVTDSKRKEIYLSSLYKSFDDTFFLLKVRPKTHLGLCDKATLDHLEFFVNIVFRNKKARLIPLLENWQPGIGIDLIRAGYNVYYPTGKIAIDQIVQLLNMLVEHRNSKGSSFSTQMELFRSSKYEAMQVRRRDEDTTRMLDKLRREYGCETDARNT